MSSLLVFNRVYRLEIQFNHIGIFRPVLWTIVSLTFSLVALPPPLPWVNKYTVYGLRIKCGGGGSMGS
jgi:hypothetical protein